MQGFTADSGWQGVLQIFGVKGRSCHQMMMEGQDSVGRWPGMQAEALCQQWKQSLWLRLFMTESVPPRSEPGIFIK